MNRLLTSFSALMLAGCASAQGQPSLSAPLHGTSWQVLTIDGQQALSDKARVDFTRNHVSGTVGCNTMSGNLTIGPGTLVTDNLISTMMACTGLMEQESALAALLSGSPSYARAGQRLVLNGAGHKAELKLISTSPQPTSRP